MKVQLATVFSLVTALAVAQEVTLWRGETTAVRLDDSVELGASPSFISIRVGALKGVKYQLKPNTVQMGERLDYVLWEPDASEAGPRIAEIMVPETVSPGVYHCGMLDIKVIDRVMPQPKDWKTYLDLWQHPWAVSRFFGLPEFSQDHYAAMRKIYELLASAGQKALTVSIIDQPWNHQCRDAYHSMIRHIKHDDGSWSFDYSLFDEYVEFGRSCGIGPDISCYTMCTWNNFVSWENEKGELVRIPSVPGSDEFKAYWGPFLVDFAAHLKSKGWFENTLIAMDERSPEDVQKIASFVQEKAPGMRIAMAGNRKPSDFKGITIDVYSQVIHAKYVGEDFMKEVASRRENGLVTTYYVCCSPLYPNTLMHSGETEPFWLGAAIGVLGFDGFLRWAWNSWPVNPYLDASYGNWAAGDTYLCYPDGSPSWRFLELRNGIAATEKLRILAEKDEYKEKIVGLKAKFDVKAANDNKCDFKELKKAVLSVVNN